MANIFKRLKNLHRNKYIKMYIFRFFKYEIYPKICNTPRVELMCINSNGIKYELVYKEKPTSLTFNHQPVELTEISVNHGYIWLPNQTGNLILDTFSKEITAHQVAEITQDSIIIISDRYEKADDNGEFFYEWILENKPEYKNIYFAISAQSVHYKRLEEKGFKLLDFDSKEFSEKYKNASVVVSSVFADYIENHHHLRYTSGEPNSKFVFLQHGVMYLKENCLEYTKMQKINYINASLDIEKELLLDTKLWSEGQIKLSGLPRISTVVEREEGKILFAPSWDLDTFNASDIKMTKFYSYMETLLLDSDFNNHLEENKLFLKTIIHPQLEKFESSFKELETANVEVVMGRDISYKDEVATCKVFITDESSLFFDAIFRQKSVIFYHRGIKSNSAKFEAVTDISYSVSDVVTKLNSLAENNYKQKFGKDFEIEWQENTNEKLWELVVHG